jgi:hypothetical protein
MKAVQWFKGLSITKKVLLGFGTFVVLSAVSHGSQPANLNATNAGKATTSVNQVTQHPTQSKTHIPVVTTKTTTETQTIPFTSTSVQSSNLSKGTSRVTTPGVNGSETLTYTVTFTDGKQTDKKLTNTTVDSQPVTEVTTVGTYIAPPAPSCPNGTYVNTAGNVVCSPYAASSTPAGATAQCVDGTYSFSQSHSGTCSHHGGVASWL